jgi:glycerol-3-phosphate acyltransferase PlsY
MEYLFSILIGIFLGSIPTGFIFLKFFKKIDITTSGSGNVGAMNSYKVSKSKSIAFLVLLIDLLKGFLTVWLIKILFGDLFLLKSVGLIAAVMSHCFSFWIGFKGGRGLATTAGGAILISVPILLLWILLWLIAFAFRRNIHFSNFSASLLTAILSFTNAEVLNKYTVPPASSNIELSILISLLLLIILIKHIEPIKTYFNTLSMKKGKDNDE